MAAGEGASPEQNGGNPVGGQGWRENSAPTPAPPAGGGGAGLEAWPATALTSLLKGGAWHPMSCPVSEPQSSKGEIHARYALHPGWDTTLPTSPRPIPVPAAPVSSIPTPTLTYWQVIQPLGPPFPPVDIHQTCSATPAQQVHLPSGSRRPQTLRPRVCALGRSGLGGRVGKRRQNR